ncbi:MAG: hypothetical protein ABI876_10680 [Bacteroidota bacterium]
MFAISIVSCSHNGPTTVDSISLAKDDGNGKPGDAVESLKPSDKKFYALVKLDKGVDAKLKADLIAVDTPEGKNIQVLTQDYAVGGMENVVTLTYTLPQDWPAGSYKIDVSLDGKPAKSKEFMIQ